MADLTAQAWTQGEGIAFEAADVAGDNVAHASRQKLLVNNGSAGTVDVTVASEVASNPPVGPADLVVTVPAGEVAVIDISDRNFKDTVTSKVAWTYDTVTSVTVAVVSGL